jgi:hypothetical protein
MTLADLFLAVNAAGVRLANVCGQLQLRGPADAITAQIRAGAVEHKAALLALLPPAGAAEAGEVRSPEATADAVVHRPANGHVAPEDRLRPDWRDWRIEWLLELAVLYLRMRGCRDEEVLARLRPHSEATPGNLAEWLALGRRIADAESELMDEGKLPMYPWPGVEQRDGQERRRAEALVRSPTGLFAQVRGDGSGRSFGDRLSLARSRPRLEEGFGGSH